LQGVPLSEPRRVGCTEVGGVGLVAVIVVLSVSVLLQFAAAVYALLLVRSVGGRIAWISLSAAIFLMTIRRVISLVSAITHYPDQLPMLNSELVGLLISVLVLVAVLSIRPLFESIRRSEHALAVQTRRNQVILDSSPDGFVITDLDGNLREVNRAFCRMVGLPAKTLLGMNVVELDVADSSAHIHRRLAELRDKGEARYETRYKRSDNVVVDLDVAAKYVEIGEQRFIFTFYRDITARKKAEAELFGEKERALVTLDSIGDGVVTTDVDGRIQFMNPVMEHLTDCRAQHAVGRSLEEIMQFKDETSGEEIVAPIEICIRQNKSLRIGGQTLLAGRDGRGDFSVEVSVSPVHNHRGDIVGTVLVLHDVTELRGLARQLSYQATHDSLTGLINRREFEVRLDHVLETARRQGGNYALCYLDLDQFKVVNDTCGHVAGDDLLRQLARELNQNIRDQDTIGRLGGDEFGVLLTDCEFSEAEQVADKLRSVVQAFRFVWQQNAFEVGVSIGLVPITQESGTLTDILSAADSACYVAKEHGRNRVHVFQHNDQALARHHRHMRWLQQIQRALEDNRFKLYYQLIKPVSEQVSRTCHAELLLRMVNGGGDIITPGSFLPAAERYHLMPMIDRWVVANAFRIIKQQGLPTEQEIDSVSINLSGQSLGDERFLGDVLELFDEFGVAAQKICFEITETSVIANLANAQTFIDVLHERGCRFALDDFGSGLSSFSYLKVLPVDFLKIDGSFVRGILHDKNDLNMVKSINQIGHLMGMQTIAEFVEERATQERIIQVGVDYIQGFAIGKPKPLLAESVTASSKVIVLNDHI
jgi:diguanylate cyclase (GGDEF)-like protein/PAS domain S-box-containing protein